MTALAEKTDFSVLTYMHFPLIQANDKRLNNYLVSEVNLYKKRYFEDEEKLKKFSLKP